MLMADPQVIVALAVFLGVIVRVVFPYLKKVKETNEVDLTFAPKYVATAIIGIIFVMITGLGAIASMPALGDVGGVELFIGAFTYAFAFQSGINKIAEAF